MKTEVDTYIAAAYCLKVLIYNQTDDETFELWDSSNLQLLQSKNDLLIISDRLCLSVLTFCTVSVIGISVKSYICTPLPTKHDNFMVFDKNHAVGACINTNSDKSCILGNM